ncbi:hypothetical protein [Actinacidiphila oryziradicis]|uniref:hypothetical protein n=1 Tax=Actinacidiphila oryziradicis TaxID=2571141 RepID=UPI0023EFB2BD|nr:hypothetical protein [Actinacidiphila oryziradicis]MCW2869507.1 hypothetical protein [Actinacidiphila oryziradicis]
MTGTLIEAADPRTRLRRTERLVHMLSRHRHVFLTVPVPVTIGLGIFGLGVFGRLAGGGWTPADSDSARADVMLREHTTTLPMGRE